MGQIMVVVGDPSQEIKRVIIERHTYPLKNLWDIFAGLIAEGTPMHHINVYTAYLCDRIEYKLMRDKDGDIHLEDMSVCFHSPSNEQ